MDSQEIKRLAALRAFGVLDTPAEESFDRLTALAAALFDAPIALVSLVDAERQWFKSRQGLDAVSTPREWAFCHHAIAMGPEAVMVVEDAQQDARFATNPLVTGHPDIRFYTGAVLTTRDGDNLGTLCVIDDKPRPRPNPAALERLQMLARIVVDELELARATRAAREQQRLLELAGSMSGLGHWRYEVADGKLTWSDEVYRIYGVDRETFDPRYDDAVSFYHPDDQPTVLAMMRQAIETKAGYEFQLRLNSADGVARVVIAKAICELDDKGEVVAVFGVFQDITAQTRTLKAVQRSERRYRLLADNMSDVVTRIGLDGASDYISPGIRPLLGYEPSEMAGRPAQSFVHPDDQSLILRTFAEMARGTDRLSVQHRAVHKDGGAVWVETGFQLIRDEDDQPVEIVAVIRDISQRKAMEDDLRAARAEAESAAAVKAEFLANMSHELRTPLTAVLGFTRLVDEQPELTSTTRGYLARVGSAGKALLSTVNDILDFSKLEAGQVQIKPQPVDVATLVRETTDLLGAQAAEKHLRVTVEDLDALPPSLWADPDRLRQILLNLVGNAVKFTDAGQVVVGARFDANAGRLAFEVSDSGPGIAVDRQGQLFQRFSQIDGGSTRKHGGTGLGLAICKGLVEAMGGEIGVTSGPGRGARFWFSVPAEPPCARPDAIAPSGPLAGVRVLVADDNPVNRELVRAMLTPFDAEIVEAADGVEAVAVAQAKPFDVILMDLRMPRLDGQAAALQIRDGDGLNAAVPIIAFSAEPGLGAQGVFDDVVAKPIAASSLLTAITNATAWADVSDAA